MSSPNDFLVDQMGDVIVIMPSSHISALDNINLAESRSALIEAIRNTNATSAIVDFSHVGYFGSHSYSTRFALSGS